MAPCHRTPPRVRSPQTAALPVATLPEPSRRCLSDHYGDIVIPNMGPNRYAVTVVPPDPRQHNGDTWIRTTTLEGGHDWDAWLIEGIDGYDTELIVGGERVPPVIAGFVKLTHNDQAWNDAEATRRPQRNTYTPESRPTTTPPAASSVASGNGVLTGKVVVGRAVHRLGRRIAAGRHQPGQRQERRRDRQTASSRSAASPPATHRPTPWCGPDALAPTAPSTSTTSRPVTTRSPSGTRRRTTSWPSCSTTSPAPRPRVSPS